jgi:hypothetical protein
VIGEEVVEEVSEELADDATDDGCEVEERGLGVVQEVGGGRMNCVTVVTMPMAQVKSTRMKRPRIVSDKLGMGGRGVAYMGGGVEA